MKLNKVSNNVTEITINDKTILFSYNTPVAYQDLKTFQYYKTEDFFSVTTSKHINQFVNGNVIEVPQVDIEAVFNPAPAQVTPVESTHNTAKFYRSNQLIDVAHTHRTHVAEHSGDDYCDGVIRLKATAADGAETNWLNISIDELDEIVEIIRKRDNGEV